jgi:hypothetical protein
VLDESAAFGVRRRVVAVVAVAVALASLGGALGWRLQQHHHKPAAATSPPAAVQMAPASGVYIGPGDPAKLVDFGNWRKLQVRFAADYLPSASWHDISAPLWLLQRWQGSGLRLVLGVPMLPGRGSTSVAAGARGAYNRYFRTLAQNLVKYGAATASLRIGWEMNGNWYQWSAASDPAAWIAYYRNIVNTMRSVTGADFTFIWNPNIGTRTMNAEAAYPGDAYVDQIGVDIYDWEWNTPDATPQSRWQWIKTHENGLDWLASFAARHHEPISLPEWGLAQRHENMNGGGGDDPYFINHLLEWAADHHLVSEVYFNNGTHRLAHFPAAEQEYLRTERSLAKLPSSSRSRRLTASAAQ